MRGAIPLILVGLMLPATRAWASSPQLNIASFASCLQSVHDVRDLSSLRRQYRLGASDLLLVYLAVYPSVRSPDSFFGQIQELAHDRWSTRFEAHEEQLALWLSEQGAVELYPHQLWERAVSVCSNDSLCAAVSAHNVLRTLGRFRQAGGRLSNWFLREASSWRQHSETIRKRLISLVRSGRSDRYGEWYHFFGLLTLAIREAALRPGLPLTSFAAFANQILNPILAGGILGADRAQMDRDAVGVAWYYLFSSELSPASSCENRSDFVAI
jgi:hypothetical protein